MAGPEDYLRDSEMARTPQSGETDPQLHERLRSFQRILADYEGALRRLTASYAPEPADREDLFQEISLAVWTALPRFRGDCSERTWVYRIAHNVAISASVRRNRRRQAETNFAPDIADARALGPESQSLLRERQQLLIDAVRSIRGLDKQIIILYLEGLSNREMAEVVGLSEGAIATRLTRVRTTLSRLVNSNAGEI
jgi:RNA polymerase sigma-70 factor, ECF subfamily